MTKELVDRYMNADAFSKIYDSMEMTQKDACLAYLERYKSITPLEALSAFNCFRLSAVIFKLRADGYEITTAINDGEKKFAIYTLADEGDEEDG